MGFRSLFPLCLRNNFENFTFGIANVYGVFVLNMHVFHKVKVSQDKFIKPSGLFKLFWEKKNSRKFERSKDLDFE